MNDEDWLRKRFRRRVGCPLGWALLAGPILGALYLATLVHPALDQVSSWVGQ